MKNMFKIASVLLVVFLCGCMGPQASFGERFKDSFLFTSANDVSPNERQSITLIRPYSFQSGQVTYSLPAGRYIAERKHDTGYFYYAPRAIETNNRFFFPWQQGIYLENGVNKGYLFGANPNGYSNRPIRGTVLPSEIYSYIRRN